MIIPIFGFENVFRGPAFSDVFKFYFTITINEIINISNITYEFRVLWSMGYGMDMDTDMDMDTVPMWLLSLWLRFGYG